MAFASDYQPISSEITDVERAVLEATPRLVSEGAEAVRAHMIRRTGRGISTSERPFVPYSAEYARREKGGRRSPVTLIRRGDMLQNLAVFPQGRYQRVVKFRSRREERKGRAHQRRRPWFGITIRFARRHAQEFGGKVGALLPRDRRRRYQITFPL